METIGSNLPRFDYDPSTLAFRGLLVEEQRTNLQVRGSELNKSPWVTGAASISADSSASPTGAVDADKIVENTASDYHSVVNGSFAPAISGSTYYSGSFFFKASGRSAAQIYFNTSFNTGGCAGTFTLSGSGTAAKSGHVSTTARIYAVSNGYYRCTTSAQSASWATALARFVFLYNGATNTYLGDGSSGVIAWGAQIEPGPFSTSYIPTTSASATRYADDLTVSSLASIRFNPAGGTLYVSGTAPPYLAQAAVLASFNDNTSSQVIRLRMDTSGVLRAEVIDGGVTQASLALGTLTAGQSFKAVMSYAANDVRGKLQGSTAQADTSATIPTVDRLMIGRGASGEYWNSGIKRLRIFPGPLADAEQASLVA